MDFPLLGLEPRHYTLTQYQPSWIYVRMLRNVTEVLTWRRPSNLAEFDSVRVCTGYEIRVVRLGMDMGDRDLSSENGGEKNSSS